MSFKKIDKDIQEINKPKYCYACSAQVRNNDWVTTVNMVPAEPTNIPPVSIAMLSYRKPPNMAAIPVKEFNNEITTGMSAPPIESTNKTPYREAPRNNI